MDFFSTLAGMKLQDVPTRLRTSGMSQAKFSREVLDLDPSSFVKTMKGDRRLQEHERRAIESYFGEPLVADTSETPAVLRRPRQTRIPVYGYAAAGGEDRIAFAEDQVLDWFDPPPFWSGGGDLIYVRIIGESMYPRIRSGEVVPVRLNFPPARGDDCLLEFTDNSAVVKTFEAERDGKVFARQYNPDSQVSFDATSVRKRHTIWRPGML